MGCQRRRDRRDGSEHGEVRALASNPTYDPDVFTNADPAKLKALYAPSANSPLVDRATDGLYPPGSVFKPVTALAALSEGLLTPDELIQCQPEVTIAGQKFVNWDIYRNEPMTLPIALAASCDTYFYDVGQRFYYAKGTPLQDWARRLGFGKLTGLDIGPEARGLVPTPSWRRRHFSTEIDKLWKPGNSVQLAIGQGDLTVTPIQMARFYSLLANGGKLVYPHVVKDIEQPASEGAPPVVLRSFAAKPPRDLGFSASAIDIVQQGLYEATHNSLYGTSYHVFGTYPIPIAGKTGTAEKFVSFPDGTGKLMSQSWWCGYGPVPVDAHSLVVCALIENGGHGGDAAAPAALQVFAEYFHTPAPPITIGKSD